MIKAIVFDFGNVICKFDNGIFTKNISKYTNKSIEEINIYNNIIDTDKTVPLPEIKEEKNIPIIIGY